MDEFLLSFARQLASRMERLSADSRWSHRASGLRGNLLRSLDQVESGDTTRQATDRLESLVLSGYELLAKAAREMNR